MSAQRQQMQFPDQLSSVPAARRFLTFTLKQWGLVDLVDAAALAATEVVTNAVVHARSAFRLTVQADDVLLVSVHDTGPTWPGGTPQLTPLDLDSEGGRGLLLLEALSDAWGVHNDPTGKTIWFQLPLPCAPRGTKGHQASALLQHLSLADG